MLRYFNLYVITHGLYRFVYILTKKDICLSVGNAVFIVFKLFFISNEMTIANGRSIYILCY